LQHVVEPQVIKRGTHQAPSSKAIELPKKELQTIHVRSGVKPSFAICCNPFLQDIKPLMSRRDALQPVAKEYPVLLGIIPFISGHKRILFHRTAW